MKTIEEYFVDCMYELSVRQGLSMSRDEVAREFYKRPDKNANILAPIELQCEWLRSIGYQDVS